MASDQPDTHDVLRRLRTGNPFHHQPIAPDRRAFGSPTGLRSGNAPMALPVEPSEREPTWTTVPGTSPLVGPRGRDESGQRVEIPSGLPPSQEPGGWGIERLIEKSDQRPVIPPQYERRVDVPVSVNAGRLLDTQAGFTWRTIQIDNYSKVWLYVAAAARYVMPYCVGCQFPVQSGSSKIEVDAAAPPGLTQPAAPAAAQSFTVCVIETCNEYSPGLSIINAGALP